MTDSAPIRLVALGYQGFGNLGDEAILTGIERLLKGTRLTVSTIVTGPRTEAVDAYPEAVRFVAPRLLPSIRALRAIQRADALMLAGGGLIHDHWATVLPRYLAWILAARILSRRVAWVSVGVGPLRRRPWLWMARLAARLSHVVVVRDERSAALLAGAGNPHVAPDAALFNDLPIAAPVGSAEVGIVVRDPGPAGGAWRATLVEGLADGVVALRREGRIPIILTMAGSSDAAITRELHTAVRRRGEADVTEEALGPSVDGAIRRLASLDGVVSVRLHGLILGLLAGAPSVAVAYDDKVRAVAAELGSSESVIDLPELDGARITAQLDRASDAAIRERVAERVTALRAGRSDLAQHIANALEDGGTRD